MQHEQWATVQIEQPTFIARRGVWALGCCYLTAFAAIATIGVLGPNPINRKVYRDVDYGVDELRGTSIEYDDATGDALWKVNLNGLTPEKQFIHVNALLQRPGWHDGPKSARNIEFEYRQEFTLFSEYGTASHYLVQHSDALANHTHHHHVVCRAKHRFCDPFPIFRKDYLVAAAVHLVVRFRRPELFWDGGHHITAAPDRSADDERGRVPVHRAPKTMQSEGISSRRLSKHEPLSWGKERHHASSGAADDRAAAGEGALEVDLHDKGSSIHGSWRWSGLELASPEEVGSRSLWGSAPAPGGDASPPASGEASGGGLLAAFGSAVGLGSTSGGGSSAHGPLYVEGAPTMTPTLPVPTPAPSIDFFNFNQNATWTLLLETVTVNGAYTQYELSLRYVFLVVTVCVFIKFMGQMNKLSAQMWGYQQKWILVLLGSLCLFDGPLTAPRIYAVNYDIHLQMYANPDENHGVQQQVRSNELAALILVDVCTFCTTSFIAILMVYFLCILEEMGSGSIWKFFGCDLCTNRVFSNSIKGVVVGSFWVTTFVAYLFMERARDADPSFTLFDGDENEARFVPAVIAIACLFALYAIWGLVLLCDAARALRSLSTPFRLIAFITLVTMAITLVGPFVGAFYSIPRSAPTFAVFFGALNLYVYVLAFAYMPKLDDMALGQSDPSEGGITMRGGTSGSVFGSKDLADLDRELGEMDDDDGMGDF